MIRILAFLYGLSVLVYGETVSFCPAHWERFSTQPLENVGFPDPHTLVYRYRFEASDKRAYELKGEFPLAKFFSIDLYDGSTQRLLSTLTDAQLIADPKSSNPFRKMKPSPEHRFTLYLLPQTLAESKPYSNKLIYPANQSQKTLEVWIRVVGLKETKWAPPSLNQIGGPSQCTNTRSLASTEETPVNKNAPPKGRKGYLDFFRMHSPAPYSHPQLQTLVARLGQKDSQVNVFRFKPLALSQFGADGKLISEKESRYWSFCLAGFQSRVSQCLSAEEMKPNADGFITVVIGPASIAKVAAEKGINFIERKDFVYPIAVLQNYTATPDNGLGAVKTWPPTNLRERRIASLYIAPNFLGEAAPVGRVCDQNKFLKDVVYSPNSLCAVKN